MSLTGNGRHALPGWWGRRSRRGKVGIIAAVFMALAGIAVALIIINAVANVTGTRAVDENVLEIELAQAFSGSTDCNDDGIGDNSLDPIPGTRTTTDLASCALVTPDEWTVTGAFTDYRPVWRFGVKNLSDEAVAVQDVFLTGSIPGGYEIGFGHPLDCDGFSIPPGDTRNICVGIIFGPNPASDAGSSLPLDFDVELVPVRTAQFVAGNCPILRNG